MDTELRALQMELSKTRPKIPFIAKLLRILNYTIEHPDTVRTVGAFWSHGQKSFVSNPKILGAFLGVKCNSVNVNFHEEGFTLPKSISKYQLSRRCRSLQGIESTDAKHWKERQHTTLEFTPAMTLQQAIVLGSKCRTAFRQNQIQQTQQSPQELGHFLDFSNPGQATQQWIKHFGPAQFAPLDKILNAFLPIVNHDDVGHINQLRINFTHLCSLWMKGETLLSQSLTFDGFVAFFHCFGSSRGVRDQLEEITPAGSRQDSFPWFYRGICLGADKRWFAEAWGMAPPETWALIEGEEEEGTFRLLTRTRMIDGNQDRCRIVCVDTTNEQQHFSFQINDDDDFKYVSNLSALLKSLELVNHNGLCLNQSDIVKQSSWPDELFLEVIHSSQDEEMFAFLDFEESRS